MDKREYEELKKTIEYHMDKYYNQDAPEISDFDYDMMMKDLKKAEKEHPEWVTPDSPSQKVGGTAKRKAGVKITHNVPMLSIEDVFSHEEVAAWVSKVHEMHPDAKFSVEAKIDGLSLTLRYRKNGSGKMSLYMAETRGDGLIGEDVFENALVIPDIKHEIDLPYDYLELRGEVYMTHEDFEKFNDLQESEGKKLAANPRNLAAGTLRQLDASITKERGLRMFIFNVQDGPAELMTSQSDTLDLLEKKGIKTVRHTLCKNTKEVLDAIEELGALRSELEYDIDGAVVKLDNISYRKDFPSGSKYSAGHIAYKYPPEERPVELQDVEVTVGRTGKLGFIGHVLDAETGKPARLCGTNVTKVTLHNQDYIDENKIGIGGVYLLKKSGDIIPKICGTVKVPENIYKATAVCPVCGEKLIREDTADIRCVNPMCPAQLSRTISYFTSIDCMNIMGLGETLIDTLVREGYLKDYSDIYALRDRRDELINKGIIGKEKNTDKVLANIEESKKNDPVRLLTALGIRNVGKATAKELMKKYSSIEELSQADIEELTEIQDIGETTAECIYEFFRNEKDAEVISKLISYGVNTKVEKSEDGEDQIFEGMTFVLTGTLPNLKRNEAEDLIEKYGGKCSSSVSKKTSVVLAGEEAGSKLDKARELGIKIIDEAQFKQMLGQ